jgi:hypothetical protein
MAQNWRNNDWDNNNQWHDDNNNWGHSDWDNNNNWWGRRHTICIWQPWGWSWSWWGWHFWWFNPCVGWW